MEIEEINFDNVQLVLDEYGKEFTEMMKQYLQSRNSKGYNRVASGALLSSIRTTTEPNSNHSIYKVFLHHKDYLKYVENDTRPHYPPIKPLIKWVQDKRIPLPTGTKPMPEETKLSLKEVKSKGTAKSKKTKGTKNAQLEAEKRIAYAVQKKIGKEGTKGTPYVEQTQNSLYPKYEKRIQEALEQDVYDAMRQQSITISIHVV